MNHSFINSIHFDRQSFIFNGQREILISGEFHYSRLDAEDWDRALENCVKMGINTIATYIFWNCHEEQKGVFNFSENRDLGRFLTLCRKKGLKVFLRIGPYSCGEWNYGGFPCWLRDEPGIVFRTFNPAFMERVEIYFKKLFEVFIPHLATRGGAVTMVQVENEYSVVGKWYGEEGVKYNAWIVDLVQKSGVDVPLMTCEGGTPGAIECANGFNIKQEIVEKLRAKQPDAPLIWTELWPGWYNTWGFAPHHRDVRHVAYAILRFIAQGGSGFNYYMWFGGTNFGRTAMFQQCTAYGFDWGLDEYGRVTSVGLYLCEFHRALKDLQQVLIEGERTCTQSGEVEQVQFTLKEEVVQITFQSQGEKIGLDGQRLPEVILSANGRVIFDSLAFYERASTHIQENPWTVCKICESIETAPEPMPQDRQDSPIEVDTPEDQLKFTHDRSDYCWYSCEIFVEKEGIQRIRIPYGADFLYLYCDGEKIGSTSAPLKEWRGSILRQAIRKESGAFEDSWAVQAEKPLEDGYLHEFVFEAKPGNHQIDILATAIGMVKGDWSISSPMHCERKGIWDEVFWNENPLRKWKIRPFLNFEKIDQKKIPWRSGKSSSEKLTWHRFTITLSTEDLRQELDWRLDLELWGKGMAFINGRMIGRYWLLEANGYGVDEVWHPKDCGLYIQENVRYSQQYYVLPRSWLKEGVNEIVLLEEQKGGDRISIQHRLMAR